MQNGRERQRSEKGSKIENTWKDKGMRKEIEKERKQEV